MEALTYMVFIPWILFIALISFLWAVYGMRDYISKQRHNPRSKSPGKENDVISIDKEGTVIQL